MIEAVEHMDGYTESNFAAESIEPHELVTDSVGSGVSKTDGSDARWSGIAMAFNSAAWAHENDDDTSALEYDGSNATLTDNDRVPYGGYEDGATLRPLTCGDTGGNESAPNISEGDVVGVIDTSAGTLTSTDEYTGRVVQEGYTDGESTPVTYNRSNSNFLAIGIAKAQGTGQVSVTGFDEQLRVEVDKSL